MEKKALDGATGGVGGGNRLAKKKMVYRSQYQTATCTLSASLPPTLFMSIFDHNTREDRRTHTRTHTNKGERIVKETCVHADARKIQYMQFHYRFRDNEQLNSDNKYIINRHQ